MDIEDKTGYIENAPKIFLIWFKDIEMQEKIEKYLKKNQDNIFQYKVFTGENFRGIY